MNIDLKMNIDEILYVQKLIELTRTVYIIHQNQNKKFIFSIVLDIGQKINKKASSLDEILSSVTKKKYKIKFKFHEAIILERFLIDVQQTENDPFNLNLARSIISQLNQKMA